LAGVVPIPAYRSFNAFIVSSHWSSVELICFGGHPMLICPHVLKLTPFLLLFSSVALEVKRLSNSANGIPFDTSVTQYGIQQLVLSQGADQQAIQSSISAQVSREELVGRQAVDVATSNYDKVRGMTPEARAQLLEVRKFAHRAQQRLDHIKLISNHWKTIVPDAAKAAREAARGWIKESAEKTAEHSATIDNRMNKLANAVAAAAEPYHLAILRNQKFCDETYSKAKTAQSSSLKLIADSKALALKAQELQTGGLGIDAQSMFGVASGMISQAEELRQWGNKFYNEANAACGGVAGYQMQLAQAATNAAMTTIMNAPMKLPPE
jgi:hypothetical protein